MKSFISLIIYWFKFKKYRSYIFINCDVKDCEGKDINSYHGYLNDLSLDEIIIWLDSLLFEHVNKLNIAIRFKEK